GFGEAICPAQIKVYANVDKANSLNGQRLAYIHYRVPSPGVASHKGVRYIAEEGPLTLTPSKLVDEEEQLHTPGDAEEQDEDAVSVLIPDSPEPQVRRNLEGNEGGTSAGMFSESDSFTNAT
ncbi:hypothetical protein CYMTET_35775, partial [Cymbomonas tetramitiformis]